MADEVTDCSTKEQFVICLCSVNNDFQPIENCIGLYDAQSNTANRLVRCRMHYFCSLLRHALNLEARDKQNKLLRNYMDTNP